MSVKEAAKRWNLSERWVQKLCEEGRIEGVQRFGRSWMIPKTATKPNDLRRKGGDSHVQVRTNKVKPNCASNRLICLITAGGEMNNSSAALLKLPEAGKSLYQDAK